jgi:hypothetical protein
LIIASIKRSLSTTVQTQQPKRLVPQLGVVVSTTSGHSPPSEAPCYMPSSDLLSCPPRVFDLHQVKPDVVVAPVLDGAVDERVGQADVGAEAVADAAGFVVGHGGGAALALGLARAEDEDGLTVGADHVANELVGRPDLEPFGTPAELRPRRRVALAHEVDPEGVLDFRRQLVRRQQQPMRLRRLAHAGQRRLDPGGDERLFDEGVGGDDVDRLGALGGGQVAQGVPDQLQDGGGVLAAP